MSPLRKHLPLLATLIVAISLGLPTAALAAASPSPGVHVDPSSPVAKEYALPLATARGAPADTGATGSLFGKGITKPKTNQPAAASSTVPETDTAVPQTTQPSTQVSPLATVTATQTTPTAGTHVARHHHHRAGNRPQAPARTHPVHARPQPAKVVGTAVPTAMRLLHPGSGSSWLWMLLAALAVLAVGGAGAFLLVHMRQRDPN